MKEGEGLRAVLAVTGDRTSRFPFSSVIPVVAPSMPAESTSMTEFASEERHAMSGPDRVSLVVPVRDEERTLSRLVESIQAQTRPPDEVLLVDGGSSDRTVELALALGVRDSRFRCIDIGPATPGRGRNLGVRAARFDWIAFTDAGIILEPNWLEELVQRVEKDPALDVVYGNVEPVRDTFFTRCAALAYVPIPSWLSPNLRWRGPFIASSLMRRSVWEAAGGFPDLRAAEDLIFMENVERAGARIAVAPEAMVHWQLRPDLLSTYRKFVLYSKHNVWAGRQYDWHHGIARTYLLLLPFLGLAAFHHPAWVLVPVLGALARVARSIWRRADPPRWRTLINPAVFGMVFVIMTTIDLATFVGWAQAKRERPPQPAPSGGNP